MWTVSIAAWTVLMCSFPGSGFTAERVVLRFSVDLPPGATTHNVQIKDGALVLAEDASGNYMSEGYVDIPVPPLLTRGRMIAVDAIRMDSLVAGDFEGLSGHVANLYAATGASYTARAVGSDGDIGSAWFSESKWPSLTPEFVTDTSGNVAAVINRQGALEQFFAVGPGQDYRLALDLDPTRLSVEQEQAFTISLSYYTTSFSSEFGNLLFRNPRTGDASSSFAIHSSGPTDGVRRISLRFRTLDADDHEQYVDSDGVPAYFNFAAFGDGTAMVVTNDLDGTLVGDSYGNADIQYAVFRFKAQWIGTSSDTGFDANVAVIDNITLDREDQIEIALLDAGGEVLQRSTLASGFMAEVAPAVIRLYLRSHIPSRTPQVRSLEIFDVLPIAVARGPKLAMFTQPRLGFTGFIPPRLEWADETIAPMRTRCVDVFAGDGSTMSFIQFLATNGVSRWRHAMQGGELQPTWDASSDELTLGLTTSGDGPRRMGGEEFLRRYRELADHGFRFLQIIDPTGFLESDLRLKSDFIPPGGEATDADQIVSLHVHYARKQAEFFDGVTSVTLSDGSIVTPPLIGDYQVFVESNLGQTEKWYNALFGDGSHTAILNAVAQAVRDVHSDARIATSINPHGDCFDFDYFSRVWTDAWSPDADVFTHLGVNTFTRGCAPEAFAGSLLTLRSGYLSEAWRPKSLSIGAFAVDKFIYDPAIHTNDWKRGYGSPLFGKRVARETLCNLRLPARDIYYYSPFDSDGWRGGNLYHDPGWRSHDSWTPLFERVWGTGILGESHDDPTAGPDEPSVYMPNEGGLAFMTLARHLSVSSPLASTVVNTNPVLEGEHYYSALFEDKNQNYVLALWFFRDYEYGSAYMDYVSGFKDTGFVERRVHDVALPGLGTFTAATLIPLDGSRPHPLSVRTGPGGLPVIERVAFGEMPVLIRLRRPTPYGLHASITHEGNSLTITFPTEAGSDRVVEHTEALLPAQWMSFPDGPHNSGMVVVPTHAHQGFFRIRTFPANPETE